MSGPVKSTFARFLLDVTVMTSSCPTIGWLGAKVICSSPLHGPLVGVAVGLVVAVATDMMVKVGVCDGATRAGDEPSVAGGVELSVGVGEAVTVPVADDSGVDVSVVLGARGAATATVEVGATIVDVGVGVNVEIVEGTGDGVAGGRGGPG